MLLPRRLAAPRFVAMGIALDRAPPALWLALLIAALLPTWCWMGRRVLDGSDEPLGVLALATLLGLAWTCRGALRAAPRLRWFAAALTGAVLGTATQGGLPPLLCALFGLLASGAALLAFLPSRIACAPVLGLSLLSLPLLASLQFYAGYPLRVVTAEASRWLLMPGFAVERAGASLQVDGRLVIVDAPCSGVQMVWLGYFTACVAALCAARTDRSFLPRLPVVGVLVLAGNVVRNGVLVALEAGGAPRPSWAGVAVGLAVLALVCVAIATLMSARGPNHV